MKRYIRTNDYDRLRFVKNGQEQYLPTWFMYKSDEEVEEAKQKLINAPDRTYNSYEPIEIDEDKIRRELKKEGFSSADIDEIIAMIYNGMTVDSAIQRQLIKYDDEYISSSEDLTDEEMEAELSSHFADLNSKLDKFQAGKLHRFKRYEDEHINIERMSLDEMIRNYVKYFNINVRESGYGFETDWDDDDWLYILYKDGTQRTVNPSVDDGTKRIKINGIDSMIVDGSWGSAYAGPHVQIINYREQVGYKDTDKYGYGSVAQRYNDMDDLRLEFTT